MIKARYIGVECELQIGKVYPIKTRCTGNKLVVSVSDPTGVAVAWGHEARAKGCKGSHLILSDWKYVGARYSDGDYMDPYDKERWELTGAKMVVVDGENIKEDTYYRCIEGEIVEVTEDGEIVEE